jgi:phosphatidylglycerophosphatase A
MNNILTIYGLGRVKFSASLAALIAAAMFFGICCAGKYPLYINNAVFVIVLIISVLTLDRVKLVTEDPKEVIIDEFLGMYASLLVAGLFEWYWVLAQFVVFRVLDIIKPFPFNWIERKLNGRYGLLLDDIVIGIVGGIGFLLVRLFVLN